MPGLCPRWQDAGHRRGRGRDSEALVAATDPEAAARKTELDPDDPASPAANNDAGDRLAMAGRPTEAETPIGTRWSGWRSWRLHSQTFLNTGRKWLEENSACACYERVAGGPRTQRKAAGKPWNATKCCWRRSMEAGRGTQRSGLVSGRQPGCKSPRRGTGS